MTKMIVITGFVIAFSAGLMSGIAWKGHPGARPHQGPESRESWIADQLKLSPEQQKQMKDIWSEVGGRRESWDRRNQLRKERDEALASLIRPEDKPEYDRIIAESKQKQDAVEAEGKKAFQQAVEKTKAILNAEQLKKYEEVLSRGPGGRGRDGRDGRDRPPPKPGQPALPPSPPPEPH